MLRKIDSKKILFKYRVGNCLEDTNVPIYSDIQVTYGHILDLNGDISNNIYGVSEDYDIAVLLNYTITTKLIDKFTAIYINEMPSNLFPNGEYSIIRIDPVKINTFILYLKKVDGISYPTLYFNITPFTLQRFKKLVRKKFYGNILGLTQLGENFFLCECNDYGDKILFTKLNFDKSYLVGYIPKQSFVPFDKQTKIWTSKPKNIEDMSNRIRLVKKELVYGSHYKLTFEKI